MITFDLQEFYYATELYLICHARPFLNEFEHVCVGHHVEFLAATKKQTAVFLARFKQSDLSSSLHSVYVLPLWIVVLYHLAFPFE